MLIGASLEMQDEAWEFVQFMTSEESQKLQTLSASTLPTLNALYEDREIRKVLPVITLSEEALRNARPRPISPYYSQISRTMAEQFNKVLTYLTRRGRRDSPERFAAYHRAGLISPQTKVLRPSSHRSLDPVSLPLLPRWHTTTLLGFKYYERRQNSDSRTNCVRDENSCSDVRGSFGDCGVRQSLLHGRTIKA